MAFVLATTKVNAQDIRAVDFRNRSWAVDGTCLPEAYQLAGRAPRHIETHEGVWEDPGHGSFGVGPPSYGDLDGDGTEEAAVVTWCQNSGSGNFTNVRVFSVRRGRLRQIARVDGVDGESIESAEIENGALLVRQGLQITGGGRHHDFISRKRFVLRRGHIQLVAPLFAECPDPTSIGIACEVASGASSWVHFAPGTNGAERILPLGDHGQLSTLSLWVVAGQTLYVQAGCGGGETPIVSVLPPGPNERPDFADVRTPGEADENDHVARLSLHAIRSGEYRLSTRIRADAGNCWIILHAF